MKAPLNSLILSAVIAVALLTSCESKEQKVVDAKQNVQDSKEDLKDAKRELNAEYPAFKRAEEEKIEANDKHIAELKAKLAKPGKAPLDNAREQKIESLEKQNAELKSRLYGYETERSDWETFKAKFNKDADNLHDAFQDFGNDLKKKD